MIKLVCFLFHYQVDLSLNLTETDDAGISVQVDRFEGTDQLETLGIDDPVNIGL